MSKFVIDKLLAAQPSLGKLVCALGGGLSNSYIYKVDTAQGLQVLKVQQDNTERNFLTQLCPKLIANPTWLPILFNHGEFAGWNWMLMEYIPKQWPTQRFNFDDQALSVLKQLHAIPVQSQDFNWVDQTWTGQQLELAFKYLPRLSHPLLEAVFNRYQALAQKNLGLCSGDPNVPNWLIRENGEIVLIDWQQVALANRALDVAGWLSKMLDFSDIKRVSRLYLQTNDPDQVTEQAKDIAIYFCRRCATNYWRAEISAQPELWKHGNKRMSEVFPVWLEAMLKQL